MNQQLVLNFFLFILSTINLVTSYPSIRSSSPAKTHAILIAGTSGWINYRHQANVAHGYQILRSHGVPEENIIVMSPNDVVNSKWNPLKGKLFNSPDGSDVYSGLNVDYSADQVTVANFLSILNGSSSSQLPKVLKSGPNDSVFIYISSIGSTGLIGFPHEILTSKAFNRALIDLKLNEKFGQLLIYLDSDYSGSMFDSVLPEGISIYSVSATSENQENVACFCNNQLIRKTCLSNSFATAWLSDSGSKSSLTNETLLQQFKSIVNSYAKAEPSKKLTPGQFGDFNVRKRSLGEFMGSSESLILEKSKEITGQLSTFEIALKMDKGEIIKTDIVQNRRRFDHSFWYLIDDMCHSFYCKNATETLSSRVQLINHDIYHEIVTRFQKDCLNISRAPYAMSKMHAFASIIAQSEEKLTSNLSEFLSKLYQGCRRRIITRGYEDLI